MNQSLMAKWLWTYLKLGKDSFEEPDPLGINTTPPPPSQKKKKEKKKR